MSIDNAFVLCAANCGGYVNTDLDAQHAVCDDDGQWYHRLCAHAGALDRAEARAERRDEMNADQPPTPFAGFLDVALAERSMLRGTR